MSKSPDPAKFGNAAYVRNATACGNSTMIGKTEVFTSSSIDFERNLVVVADGAVARFKTRDEASEAACHLAWANQSFGSIPIAHLRDNECRKGFVDVAGFAKAPSKKAVAT